VSEVDVLAVDVGATSTKYAGFSRRGEIVGAKSRRPTSYPCSPERLVAAVASRVQRLAPVRVGLGFPGEVANGVVVDAANLARAGGPRTAVDEQIAARWRGFDLRGALARATGCPTLVMNDAAMAAVGCASGRGRELVVTLGTGCVLALVSEGRLVATRDVGDERFVELATYDEALGERGRARDPEVWLARVVAAVDGLAEEFRAGVVHLAGGNARRLAPRSFAAARTCVVIERDDPALIGAWRAWSES
jgi:polyphosphate glucokinase